jgi:hypothetical protein
VFGKSILTMPTWMILRSRPNSLPNFPSTGTFTPRVNDAGAGLHGAVATLTQNAPAEARAQAVGDILHRQQGTALVQTGIDTSATDVSGRSLRTLEPQQVNTPQQLSSSEQLAILDAHLKDKLGVDPMNADRGQQLHQQQEQLATRQLQERFESRRHGVANTSNAALLQILKIYPNLVDLFAPGTAETTKPTLIVFSLLIQLIRHDGGKYTLSVEPSRTCSVLPAWRSVVHQRPASFAIKSIRLDSREHRLIPSPKLGSALATIIASNIAMGRSVQVPRSDRR